MGIVLRYTVFGRYVFALGSNEQTARLCGLNVPALKVAVYAVGGLFVGLGSVYQFAKLKEGSPISGLGMELKVIAAVVIGGASLNGGRGTILGALAGALLMQTITSGCTQLGVKNPAQDIILGVIIVAAVAVDQWRQSRTD
jgi:ribose/xylose/arabinose/galactoside ABC-type transport system permease subunit